MFKVRGQQKKKNNVQHLRILFTELHCASRPRHRSAHSLTVRFEVHSEKFSNETSNMTTCAWHVHIASDIIDARRFAFSMPLQHWLRSRTLASAPQHCTEPMFGFPPRETTSGSNFGPWTQSRTFTWTYFSPARNFLKRRQQIRASRETLEKEHLEEESSILFTIDTLFLSSWQTSVSCTLHIAHDFFSVTFSFIANNPKHMPRIINIICALPTEMLLPFDAALVIRVDPATL